MEKQPDQKLTFAPFQEFQQEFDAANSEEGEAKNDYKFMFHVLDRWETLILITLQIYHVILL